MNKAIPAPPVPKSQLIRARLSLGKAMVPSCHGTWKGAPLRLGGIIARMEWLCSGRRAEPSFIVSCDADWLAVIQSLARLREIVCPCGDS